MGGPDQWYDRVEFPNLPFHSQPFSRLITNVFKEDVGFWWERQNNNIARWFAKDEKARNYNWNWNKKFNGTEHNKNWLDSKQLSLQLQKPTMELTNFYRKTGWQLQHDEIFQLPEMCVRGGHKVDDRDELFWQGKRIVLGQPELSFEFLSFDRLLDRPSDIPAVHLTARIEILLGRYGAWIVRNIW